jgi:hypothetical protein
MSAVKKFNIVDIESGLGKLAHRNLPPEEYGKELIALFSSSATLKRLGTNKANTSDFENGLLWREKLHYVPCSPSQLNTTIEEVKKSNKTLKAKVRLVVVNDGSHILVYDRKYNELTDCTIDKIKDEPQLFLPLTGQEGFRREAESEVDIKATGKLAKLYDALIEKNPEWLEGDKRHALNHFMTQIIFCLFSEDTGIFPKDIFTKALRNRADNDGEHATQVITEVFSVLDVDEPSRAGLAPWLTEFPYVNGGLFSGEALVPEFTPKAYRYLLEAASLDWKHINPDILGSSIQAIVDPTMRGNLGMHYTSVPNILKTLEPLFLNELRDELLKARHSKKQINAFLERLSKIVVFDPACGSGNFLVIAYRELRKLELQALDALRDLEGGASLAFGFSSVISLSHFYGIEYADFAAETAKLALWIAEYQQNTRFRAAFGTEIPALPLKSSGVIVRGNALRVNWREFCNVKGAWHVYIVGNPPYLGVAWMSKEQKEDMKFVFEGKIKNFASLDYVCGWFMKATLFCQTINSSFAFVATNSITQGSHASTLWKELFKCGVEIGFAHLSFKWSNNAASNAAVICIIVGMRRISKAPKILIDEKGESTLVNNLNGYLINAPHADITARSKPMGFLPQMYKGSQPTDGGNLILSPDERERLIAENDKSESFIRRYIGSQELIKGILRYCIWVPDEKVKEAYSIRGFRDRFENVKEMRSASSKKQTREFADSPHKFTEIRHIECGSVIGVPRVSSENRDYLPADLFSKAEIISDSAFAIYDAQLWHFSILVSRMSMLWIKAVCGKLKNDIRFSNTLGWNTFPIPKLTSDHKELLDKAAREILLIRERHFPKTISELYDREKLPKDLFEAHQRNDQLLEEIYHDGHFTSDDERLAYLFKMYVKLSQGGVQ